MNWQPISTAPKNPAGEMLGPTILIFYQADFLPWPAYWGPNPEAYAEGVWWGLSDDERPFNTDDVTHWMPLPDAPAKAIEARQGQDPQGLDPQDESAGL